MKSTKHHVIAHLAKHAPITAMLWEKIQSTCTSPPAAWGAAAHSAAADAAASRASTMHVSGSVTISGDAITSAASSWPDLAPVTANEREQELMLVPRDSTGGSTRLPPACCVLSRAGSLGCGSGTTGCDFFRSSSNSVNPTAVLLDSASSSWGWGSLHDAAPDPRVA